MSSRRRAGLQQAQLLLANDDCRLGGLQIFDRFIELLARRCALLEQAGHPRVILLGQFKRRFGDRQLGPGGLLLLGTRPVDQQFQPRLQLAHAGLGLPLLLGAKAGLQAVVIRLLDGQLGLRLLLQFQQIERFQFDQHVARADPLAFLDMHAGHASADARTQADFIGFDKSADPRQLRPPLAVGNQGDQASHD
jgi:hypothetical protein